MRETKANLWVVTLFMVLSIVGLGSIIYLLLRFLYILLFELGG